MKHTLTLFIFTAIAALLLAACQNKDIDTDSFKIERERVVSSINSVSIIGSYSFSGNVDGIMVNIGEREDLNDALTYNMDIEGTNFSATVEGLKSNTLYYYNYTIDFGTSNPFFTETKSFNTLEIAADIPIVEILDVREIDSVTFRVKCKVNSDGGSEVTERGICWNTYNDPIPYDDSTRRYEGSAGPFDEYSIRMENLALGKKYYVRAYAKNAAGKTGLSEEVLDFETEAPAGMPIEIELSCNPDEGGTVSGGGTYEVGTQCTVTATANTGYTFVNWTENGAQVSSDAEYMFTVAVERALVANFTMQDYTIHVDIVPENGGTIRGAGGFNYGEECILTASPNTGYNFDKWTKDGTTVSNEPEYRFTVTETANYVAHFQIKSYTIAVSANPSEGGEVNGSGSFNHGHSCTVHAIPAQNFTFTNWTDDEEVVSQEADYTFTVTSNRNLVAHFTEQQPEGYNITVLAYPDEGGTVDGGGNYQQGDRCTVKATKNTGYKFLNWTEDDNIVCTSTQYQFPVNGDRTLVANFEELFEYTISVSATEGGSANVGNDSNATQGSFTEGEPCTVHARANEGYHFVNWTDNGQGIQGAGTNYTFTVNNNRELVAHFEPLPQNYYTITATSNPSEGGTINGANTFNQSYPSGDSCTLTAVPADGFSFVNWTENGFVVSSNANYTFTVNANRNLVAHFTYVPPTYTVSVSANPTNGGNVSGGGTYTEGQSCTVTAVPNANYTFTNWTENGTVVSTNANYTFTVNANRTLVAHFTYVPPTYTISISANPANGGIVSGGGTYTEGQSCTVMATPSTNYTFTNWTENGSVVSSNANYTFTVNANRNLVAHFTYFPQTYTVSVSANPANGGTVSGGGTFTEGETCTVTATTYNGYIFHNWTEYGTVVSNNASYTFTVTSNRTLVANFTIQPQAPQGAINGVFTINSNNGKVWFSQGNLQYSCNTWRFAEEQWDYVGTQSPTSGNAGGTVSNGDNHSISQTYNGWIDLFGWGTSGWNSGAACYQPWSASQTNSDYYPGGSSMHSLAGVYSRSDWGVYNAISNGGNQGGLWRTLTNNEWAYIFNTRSASTVNGVMNARYAKAKVANVQGVILFPDNYIHPAGVAQPVGINSTGNTGWNGNNYNENSFRLMEENGAVFLPAAGDRSGTSVYNGDGRYWSSTMYDNTRAWGVSFSADNLNPQNNNGFPSYGRSVRLVRPVQ